MVELQPLLIYPEGYAAVTDGQDPASRYLLLRIPALRDPVSKEFTHDVLVKLPVEMVVPHEMPQSEVLARWHEIVTIADDL